MSAAAAPFSAPRADNRTSDMILAGGVLLMLGVMLIPLPTFVLDMLLSMSLASSIVILLMTILSSRPLSFSVFPTVLLLTTLFGLGLNMASMKLILLHAPASLVSSRRQADVTRQRPSAEVIVHEEIVAEAAECQRIVERHRLRLHHLNALDPALEERLLHLLEDT